MNTAAYDAIIKLLDDSKVEYATFSHEPCKTSEESEIARARAGYPGVVGAKALLVKFYFSDKEEFGTVVLPGNHILDKNALTTHLPGLKKIRFATPEEMQALAGVVPGCMPPFAAPIFPKIPLLVVASAIQEQGKIGFNIAYLERSVVLTAKEYLSTVTPSFIIDCSNAKTTET